MKLYNIRVIEKAVHETIQINEVNMFVEPVRTLDDLVEWEERLSDLHIDYSIAEFETGYMKVSDDAPRNFKDSGLTSAYGKFYSIFVNPENFDSASEDTQHGVEDSVYTEDDI
jgi:hypothetical protein